MDPPNDGLPAGRSDSPRRRALELPILGVPVRFESDAAAALDAVAAAYGVWRDVSRCGSYVSALRVRPRVAIEVLSGGGADEGRGPIRVETAGARRLWLESADAAGHADVDRMEAAVRVAPALLADAGRFRDVLDTVVLFLVTRLDRQPVHAAAVAAGGRGLVLAGPSGAGKSTLAYAAHRAGLRVLSDDAVYVQLEPRPRLWGMARPMHLLPEAAARFPELAGRGATLRPNGKCKVGVEPVGAARTEAPVAEPAGLCLLERGQEAAAVESIAPDEAVAWMLAHLEPGFDLFRDTAATALAAITRGGAWRLRLPADPDEAVPCLRALFDGVHG